MNRLYHRLVWVWRVLILGLLLSFAFGLVNTFVKEGEVTISLAAIQWLFSIQWYVALTLIVLSVLTYLSWQSNKEVKRRSNFDLCKDTDRLKPSDLGFTMLSKGTMASPGERPYYEGYISRQFRSYRESGRNRGVPTNHIEVLEKIRQGRSLLLVGQPTEGKTRTAYALLRELPDFIVLSIKPDRMVPDSTAFAEVSGKSVVIFIDDLSDYVGQSADLIRFRTEVEKVAKSCVVLATCRDGAEYAQVTGASAGSLQRFYEEYFTYELSLAPITDLEKQQLAKQSGLFSASEELLMAPTPGWIVMGNALKTMENRFRSHLSNEARDTLHSVKLLIMAGISPTHRRIEHVLRDIYKRTSVHLSDILQGLATSAFLEYPATQDPVHPEAAYLVWIVDYSKEKLLNDFALLGQLLEKTEDAEGLNSLAITYAEELRNYSEAHNYCQKAIDIDENSSETWNSLGAILVGLEQYDEAVDAYRKAIVIDDSYQLAWYNLGNVFAQNLRQYNEAVDAYLRALEIDSNLYHACVNLGNILSMSEETHKEGLRAYLRAIEINENLHEAWGGLGIVMSKYVQDHEAAIDAFRRALDIDKNAHEIWNNLSLTLCMLKRYAEALEASRNAQRLAPQNTQYWAVLGVTLSLLGENEESLYWLCKAWQARETLLVPIVDEVKLSFDRMGLTPNVCH